MALLKFPGDFVWGASTAAYQIEGAVAEDGREPSIWDTFSRTPGKVAFGDTGDIACDHYRRSGDDVALMASLGLGAYRFSVAWPRVKPDGSGLDFYDRLVDDLLAHGITPIATLYHWDLPQALEDEGGWAVRDTAARFADHASAVYEALGDRVGCWTTLNEPWCSAFLGYGTGVHAPGRTDAPFAAAHHLLLGHGMAAARLREAGARNLAITLNLAPISGPDEGAVALIDALANRMFLDPVLRGQYPPEVAEQMRPYVREGDLAVISTPLDLLGINYYAGHTVRFSPGVPADPAYPGSEGIEFVAPAGRTTAMNWPIQPDGLTEILTRVARDYPGTPLMITENGAAFDDVPSDGRVHDRERIDFLDAHLRAAHRALELGVDLRGYLLWSLLDNFEWAEGYAKRFGLVHVDFASQGRTPKDSAYWYRDVIQRNGVSG